MVIRARQVLIASTALLLAAVGPAQRDLRSVLPDDSLVAIGVNDPKAAVTALLASVGDVPKGLPAEVGAMVGAGFVMLRATLGSELGEWVDRMAAGGAAFAVVRQGGEFCPLLVLRPGDDDTAAAAAAAWIEGREPKLHAELVEDLLLVAPNATACALLRAGVGKPGTRWVEAPDPDTVLSGTVDLAALRPLLGDRSPRVEALDGPGRFLLAPLVHALETGKLLRFSVRATDAVTVHVDVDAGLGDCTWAGLSATKGQPRTMLPLAPEGLALLSLDRSFRALLDHAERYFSAGDQLGVQGFLSIAEAVDGANTSFTGDLLGGLHEPFALHVLPTPPAGEGEVRPPLLLPGIALTAPIADAAVEPILSRMAQVLATIANGERAQQNQRPFVLRAMRYEASKGFVAEAPEWRGPGRPPTEAALSPTLLCGHGHVVIATTTAAAERIMASAAAGESMPVTADLVILRGPQIAAALTASRDALELGRMLDEGEGRAEAARFFSTLITLAGAVREASLRVSATGAATHLELRLERCR